MPSACHDRPAIPSAPLRSRLIVSSETEDGSSSVAYPTQVDTAEVSRWFLMPKRKECKDCRILRYPTGKPEGVESVKVVSEYLTEDSTILAYKMLSVDAGYTYEVTWYYK